MQHKDVIVETYYGKIRGEYKDGLYVFKGVPYAKAPIGELRWLPPEPPEPWKGIREAKSFGPVCPQIKTNLDLLEGFIIDEPQSEDCLYLNIWTPGIDDNRRPVMVWIHGGAFVMGSSSHPLYRRGKLALRGDIVLVTINYRLGPFGFLNLKEITQSKIPSTGNEGLLDQIAALRWVKKNIEAFGGDPENITVFGESAGAMSLACLLVMDEAENLFQKAILQSGSARVAKNLKKSSMLAKTFFEISGLKIGDIETLRALPTEKILEIEDEMIKRSKELALFSPVVDGEYIQELPIKLMKSGKSKKVPILIGTNLDEWNLFAFGFSEVLAMDEAKLHEALMEIIPENKVKKSIEAYTNFLRERGKETLPWQILSAIQTDIFFRIPTMEIVEAYTSFGKPVFLYLFTWASPLLDGLVGACHTLELGFIFGNYNDKFCGAGPLADRLSLKMQDAWTSFARYGNPSCESIGIWPEYGTEKKIMILGKETYIEENPLIPLSEVLNKYF